MIEVQGLTLRLGKFSIENLSFSIPSGQYAVLMGQTGCGKTSVLEAVCGLRPIAGGVVRLLGREVTNLKPAERGVGYVPQDLALFPTLTVREHLSLALIVRRWDQARIEERIQELARWLRIEHLLDRRPEGLSGGEAQRTALGRALSFRPRVLLLDEPLSALDEETRQEAYELLRSVQRQTQVTALHVTHSLQEAQALGDRILRLHDGRINAPE